MALNLGKQKKLWNKGFDGIMVDHRHNSGARVFGMCDLDVGKIHNRRNVRRTGKMHKDHVKEDAASEEESSMSDSTEKKKKDDNQERTEEESLERMTGGTEEVDSEQSVKEERSEKSEDSSKEAVEVEEVGVRTRSQREEF